MNTVSVWKRSLAIFLAALMIVGMIPLSEMLASNTYAASDTKVIYLNAGGSSLWDQGGAWFAAWVNNTWYRGTKIGNGSLYGFEIPSSATKLNFVRMSVGASNPSWTKVDGNADGYWNQTNDLTISGSNNCYTITGWGEADGKWSVYTPDSYYVAGEAGLCGNAWQVADSDNKMTARGNGTYTITYSKVATGSYQFKVTKGSWNSCWGKAASSDGDVNEGSDGNCKITLSAVSNVTITFNPNASSNNMITVDIVKVQSTTTYNVAFNGTNVTSNGVGTATGGSAYTATLSAVSGYTLPSTITVKRGSTTLTAGTDYSYSSSTGKLTINGSAVTGDISITAVGDAQQSSGDTTYWSIYLKTNANWETANAWFAVYYWTDSSSGWASMQSTGETYIYHALIPAEAKVIFARMNPASTALDWNNKWNQTGNLTPTGDSYMYTLPSTVSDGTTDNKWSEYTGSFVPPEPPVQKEDFMVNTTIVDYLNDFRVNSGAVNGYSNDNQGVWTGSDRPVYTFLNGIISSQDNYTYPLYFGNLVLISNRFGVPYKSFTQGDDNAYIDYCQANRKHLKNWNTGANVALNHNNTYNAVVQGLVRDTLDEYGQLVDPKTNEQLFYFDKTKIESWTTSANGGKRLMAYYQNLKFPFSTTYDPTTRVTTYSYNSATDNAVFIDFEKYNAQNDTNPMYTSSNYAKDQNNNKGFFPLNKPGDSSNTSNYGFGVKFTIDFTVSNDGKIVSADGKETAVQFTFTGDDDVWVFIDGQLVLDMGGAHTMATGTIDFKNLTATVSQAAQVNPNSTLASNKNSYFGSSYNNANGDEQRDSLTISSDVSADFPEKLANAFKTEYNTGVSQVHTLTMFYMERGGIESNMSIQFSMTPVPTGLTVSKDIENVNPGLNASVQDDDEFSFTVDATLNNDKVQFDGYELTDHGNITTDMTAINNKITGVRGDKYAHNFTFGNLDAFTAGTSFVITEGSYDSNKYSGTRWVVYKYGEAGYEIFKSGADISAEFEMEDDTTATYAVNFINSMKSGTLTVSKSYMDTLIDHSDMAFSFKINLDLDGEGYKLYPGLTYDLYSGTSLIAEDMVSEDGTINLKAGQVAKINGIPVGTKYQVVEVDNSDRWELSSSSGTEGTMTVNGATASFVNMTSTNPLAGSVIYVEAGTNTEYNIADVTLSGVNSDTADLVKIENGKLIVNAPEAGKVYTFTYVGVHSDGRYVSGVVTVYSYKAMDKTYVFDFGLSSVISNTTTGGHGLFQGGTFIIVDDNATSTLTITGGGTQTTITASGSFDESDPSKVPTVTFTPVAFMSQVEEYTYTVTITANGKTFKANDPETGCTVTGTIKVMPANTVYYEDNFNVTANGSNPVKEIVFGSGVTVSTKNPSLIQSNDQSTNYGKDDCYKNSSSYDAYGESNGTSTTLDHLETAYFTFSGTGFDLISETKADSAGMAVYVFAGGFDQAHLDYVTNHSNTSQTPADLVFVNNYYANGSLYQVPVASVRLSTQSTYTVYVQALSTMHGDSVTIDGVRIYNPLTNTDGYKSNEKGVQIDELRVLYKNEYVGLAGKGTNNSLFVGLGRQSVVQGAMANASILEDPNGKVICTAADLENIYLHGPNNELYLPYNFGINLSYTVNSADWTLQIGAKAVTEKNEAKSFTVYVKNANGTYTDTNSFVVDVTSTTDMYYDLTEKLTEKGFGNEGSYEIIILSNSAYKNNEFVSLTTVKHKGIEIKK